MILVLKYKKNVAMLLVTFYIIIFSNSKINPDITPSAYNKHIINIFSLIFLFSLNNTISAVPLPVNKPAINENKLMALFKYNSVNIILAPQLGISPIKLVINGPSIVPFSKIFDK